MTEKQNTVIKPEQIKVDVITLTKNSSSCIQHTIGSVSYQNFAQINHIIIDGHSTDETPNIIYNYNHQKNLFFYKQSGCGIANAFNTGLSKSSGELVIFLNSGDTFADQDVVSQIVDSYFKNKWLWACGETISVSRKGYLKRHIKQYTYWQQKLFLYGNPICHQSTIYSQKIFNKVGLYNENLSLEMDYDFNIRASLIAHPYLLDFPVAYYDTSGVSSVKVFKSYSIQRKLRKKYFPLTPAKNLIIDSICFIKASKRFLIIPLKLYL